MEPTAPARDRSTLLRELDLLKRLVPRWAATEVASVQDDAIGDERRRPRLGGRLQGLRCERGLANPCGVGTPDGHVGPVRPRIRFPTPRAKRGVDAAGDRSELVRPGGDADPQRADLAGTRRERAGTRKS